MGCFNGLENENFAGTLTLGPDILQSVAGVVHRAGTVNLRNAFIHKTDKCHLAGMERYLIQSGK